MARTTQVLAAVGVADAIYRVGARERLREHLGIEPSHPRIRVIATGNASIFPDKAIVTRSRWRADRYARRLVGEGYVPKTLALPPRASRA